jgi:hypothetical protein
MTIERSMAHNVEASSSLARSSPCAWVTQIALEQRARQSEDEGSSCRASGQSIVSRGRRRPLARAEEGDDAEDAQVHGSAELQERLVGRRGHD